MRAAAVTLMGSIAVFGLAACGTNEPVGKETPSSSQTQQTDFNGTDLTVTAESDGKVSWSTYAKDGPARGTVVVEVGGWSSGPIEETVGEVYPDVNVGSYTGTVTYTNPDGKVLDKQFSYELEKADPRMTVASQTPPEPAAGDPITIEVKVEGNTRLSGTVTATETVSNSQLGVATVNEDGIASITFTPEREGGSLNIRLNYSGDQNNNESVITQVVTIR